MENEFRGIDPAEDGTGKDIGGDTPSDNPGNEESTTFVVDMPTDTEAIAAAYNAYQLVEGIDSQLCSRRDRERVERIKENALSIIDKALEFIKSGYG